MLNTKPHHTEKQQETAILVGVINQRQPPNLVKEYLAELAFLSSTLDIKTLRVFTQKLDRPDTKTFIRKGKREEIEEYIKSIDDQVDMLIFDDDLTPSQIRNLEAFFPNKKILDRSLLILQIFMIRAKTAQAKAQVELAHYQYMLPRLTRMWTHLSRQKGGIGMRGAGEKELETDRRIIRDKIALLKEKLKKIERQNHTRGKGRDRMVRVALVGYTNVGKSTLMQLVSKANVLAKNELFATVDSTVRKVFWDGVPFLLTDTVGFIRKLPTTLIECFKSTLSEIVEADILIHVVDVSHPTYEEHIRVVNQTLVEIGASDKPTLLVFNKIDNYKHEMEIGDDYLLCKPTLDELKETYFGKERQAIFISALKKQNIKEFRNRLMGLVLERHFQIYPNSKQLWQSFRQEKNS